MKKILILTLCTISFLIGNQKKCITAADFEGEGCFILAKKQISHFYSGDASFHNIYKVIEKENKIKIEKICNFGRDNYEYTKDRKQDLPTCESLNIDYKEFLKDNNE